MGTGCPPVTVKAAGLPGGSITISGAVSSQYLTALLMAAPLCKDHAVRAVRVVATCSETRSAGKACCAIGSGAAGSTHEPMASIAASPS